MQARREAQAAIARSLKIGRSHQGRKKECQLQRYNPTRIWLPSRLSRGAGESAACQPLPELNGRLEEELSPIRIRAIRASMTSNFLTAGPTSTSVTTSR